jgi:hypothetical protein
MLITFYCGYRIYKIYDFLKDKIINYFFPRIQFEDNIIKIEQINYYEVIGEDNCIFRILFETKEQIEDYIIKNNNIKLICLSYKTNKKESEKILFSSIDKFLNFNLSFEKILQKPLYKKIEKVYLYNEEFKRDITEFFLEFNGPEYNFHNNISDILFKHVLDYFDIKLGAKIQIIDNFKLEYDFNLEDKLVWNSNII